eukprot:1001828-Prorocentrum_minimum.AAC.1
MRGGRGVEGGWERGRRGPLTCGFWSVTSWPRCLHVDTLQVGAAGGKFTAAGGKFTAVGGGWVKGRRPRASAPTTDRESRCTVRNGGTWFAE